MTAADRRRNPVGNRAEERQLARRAHREHWVARAMCCGWFAYVVMAAHWYPQSVVHFVIEQDGQAPGYSIVLAAAVVAVLIFLDLLVNDVADDEWTFCWCGLLPCLPRTLWACRQRRVVLRIDWVQDHRNLIYFAGALVQIAPLFIAVFYGRVNFVASFWYAFVAVVLMVLSGSNTYRLVKRMRRVRQA